MKEEYVACIHGYTGARDHVFYRVHNEIYYCHDCHVYTSKKPYDEEMSRICSVTRQADEH